MSALRAALVDYLRIRRRLGCTMPQDGRTLEGFVESLDRAGAQRISTELALAWARLPVDVHPFTWRQRLTVARGFARYLATIDPASEVPPSDLLPGHRPRITPYVYSEQEIAALMAAARGLRPALRAARHETLIGLLAVTGCRPGEALGLDRADVDLVHVRAGKNNKQRQVPLHPSTIGALRAYAGLRDAHCPTPSTPAFFRSARGRRMGREELNATFIKLVGQIGLEGRGARARPRPHDLRHTFAVRTLLDWYRTGEDIDRRMPLLSTYLGHVDPASTYWYLEASPSCCSWSASACSDCPVRCHECARARTAGVLHRLITQRDSSPRTIAASRDTLDGLWSNREVTGMKAVPRLWVPRILSRHATCMYSWMRPPSRSRRSGRTVALGHGGVPPAGGC